MNYINRKNFKCLFLIIIQKQETQNSKNFQKSKNHFPDNLNFEDAALLSRMGRNTYYIM